MDKNSIAYQKKLRSLDERNRGNQRNELDESSLHSGNYEGVRMEDILDYKNQRVPLNLQVYDPSFGQNDEGYLLKSYHARKQRSQTRNPPMATEDISIRQQTGINLLKRHDLYNSNTKAPPQTFLNRSTIDHEREVSSSLTRNNRNKSDFSLE